MEWLADHHQSGSFSAERAKGSSALCNLIPRKVQRAAVHTTAIIQTPNLDLLDLPDESCLNEGLPSPLF
jgi:hypothetical protein